MLRFYAIPEALRIILNMFSIFSAMATALVFVLGLMRFRRSPAYWFESILSLLALCTAFLCVMLTAQVQFNIAEGFIVPSGYIAQRYTVFALILAASVYPCVKRSFALPILAAVPSFLTLPVMEAWAGRVFPAAFTTSILILLTGGVWRSAQLRRELKTSLSVLSVKQAIDSLPSAVLIYSENGHILTQNSKAQELMMKTAGRVYRNGKRYLEEAVVPNSESSEGGWLYRLPGEAWLFTAAEIPMDGKTIVQLTAADVTERESAAQTLKGIQDQLRERRERLRDMVKNIESVCRAEEIFRVKVAEHDDLNQSLTMLLRYLRDGEMPNEKTRLAAVRNLERNSAVTDSENFSIRLDSLVEGYGKSGIEIRVSGEMPPEEDMTLALTNVLRETVANAVIHGYANRIYARLTDDGAAAAMTVTDNSKFKPGVITEGGGITGLRALLAKFGGTLAIHTAERFALTASIPRKAGEANG